MLTVALVCIAAASVAYYYGRYLPCAREAELNEVRRKTNLEMVQRCSVDGTKLYADFRKRMSSALSGSHLNWGDPQMHFSKKGTPVLWRSVGMRCLGPA